MFAFAHPAHSSFAYFHPPPNEYAQSYLPDLDSNDLSLLVDDVSLDMGSYPQSLPYALPQHLWPTDMTPYPLDPPPVHDPLHSPNGWPCLLPNPSPESLPYPPLSGPLEHAFPPPSPPSPPQDLLQAYSDAPRPTFPTPSQLLTDLASCTQAPAAAKRDSDKKVETQRKARQRIVADSVGFSPTDPSVRPLTLRRSSLTSPLNTSDTISSHDKKRFYLECLEQYIMYLHDQLRLVGADPVPLERVSTYRGLTSRSIRTMLVHMQMSLKKAHEETLTEERAFLDLTDKVAALDADNDPHPASPTPDVFSSPSSF
ncbi:hypothetical protein EW146_g10176 [Bondarzewia mesenterica]|uniref:Uncharacterized protein n=1 Tax=Bondarzewia mesenterica TaxID=1095465 RepID=A0A4S4L1J3_9AGAM|nr:hypothetical protein EW146_g10176 [Bondarzewia mesenterica]